MAYGITFLAVVNKVLVRLRENEVNSVGDTAYSSLIGGLVNQVKRDIENAHTWQALRSTVGVSTVAATTSYAFTGSDERLQIIDAWNASTDAFMRPVSWQKMNEHYFGQASVQQGSPTEYTPNGISVSDGSYVVDVWPQPSGVETLSFNVYMPQLDLEDDDDKTYIPYHPLVEGTLMRALLERGEDGGTGAVNQMAMYAQALGDAIAIDAGQQPHDHVWYVV